jgi:hypothetical protein
MGMIQVKIKCDRPSVSGFNRALLTKRRCKRIEGGKAMHVFVIQLSYGQTTSGSPQRHHILYSREEVLHFDL